jgi:hypothetical protein
VRNMLALAIGVCFFSGSAIAWTAAQQPRTVSTAPTSIDEVLKAVRADNVIMEEQLKGIQRPTRDSRHLT